MRFGPPPRLFLVLITLVMVVACDDGVQPHGGCKTAPVSDALSRAFYWGTDYGDTWLPNVGEPIGDVRNPVWITQSDLVIDSERLFGGELIKGLFRLRLNVQTSEFDLVDSYPLDSSVLSAKPYPMDDCVLVVWSAEGSRRVDLVQFGSGGVNIVKTVVEEEWNPLGVSTRRDGQEVVFYGRHPVSGTAGFFVRSIAVAGAADSLLMEVQLTPREASGFSLRDSGAVVFGMTRGLFYNAVCTFYEYDATLGTMEVLATRKGRFSSISESPQNTDQLLLNYDFFGDSSSPPQDHIEILNTKTGKAQDLDVRTNDNCGHYPGNNYCSWDPTGARISFVAWYTDGLDFRTSSASLWLIRAQ